jgi:hypothetical protein
MLHGEVTAMNPMRRHFASIAAVTVAALALGEGQARASDPTTADCLAASDASLKMGNQHKLRSERSQLLVCAAASCPGDIRKECAHRVDEVNAQIPTIIFQVKDASGADISGVKVTMDGEVLAERLQGTALSIDPGEHLFTFEATSQPLVTKKFVIQQAQKDRRELVTLGTPPVAPPPPSAATPTAPPPTTRTAPTETGESHGIGTQKALALVAGGVGVIGLGIGTAFGLMAISQKSDAQSACPNSPCATQDGANKWSTAGSTGNISTVAFIVGGVAVAGAAALWLTAPSANTTQVGFGLGGVQVKGTW